MNVVLNGRHHQFEMEATVSVAVEAVAEDSDGRGMAVAVDGDVVPRSEWPDRRLEEGQRIEVVRAVQGG